MTDHPEMKYKIKYVDQLELPDVPKTIPSSPSGGVKVMSIAGRMVSERERLIGMTDEERAWRRQWLKDQVLDPTEPVISEEYRREMYNPIRRFYRAPMDKVESMLTPLVGAGKANVIRYFTAKVAMTVAALYGALYYMKYNRHDWMKKGGWKVSSSRVSRFPGDKDYGSYNKRTKGNQFNVQGFDKSPI